MSKIKLQATGDAPVIIDALRSFTSTQMLEGDKRGVRVTLHQTNADKWFADISYLTTWGSERPFTWVDCETLEVVSARIRIRYSKNMLPPGAGFPATPQYETRQAKLAGMLETITLVALSDVLAQIAEGGQL